ncbi:alpha/beta hydrolase [Actinoplanes sp. NPDC024001]|uniref:alpha/beta fold hydrolase n=1 Tax=Actinoplanes sp. NPDC024001 TaxID=3154598 RepID=UPI0033CDDB46
MGYVIAEDGAQLYYRDWGPCGGPVVVLSHGWPRHSDQWEVPALFLARHGFRVIAYDRRGHGRSAQTWDGNDLDGYADDLALVVQHLELGAFSLVGSSTGTAEVCRYLRRHGTDRVQRLVLASTVTPGGVPAAVAAALLEGSLRDRAQLYADLAADVYYGRDGVSAGVRLAFQWQALQAGAHNAYAALAACTAVDLHADVAACRVPTLIVHGDADRIAPADTAGRATAALLDRASLLLYPGAAHGLTETHAERFNADLLAFLQS